MGDLGAFLERMALKEAKVGPARPWLPQAGLQRGAAAGAQANWSTHGGIWGHSQALSKPQVSRLG